ncbi:conjugal transfer protein TraW [Massilia varians]|uniref:conjugal transfer protein TraW n=1 Tax=Massilia TaxID=149698 RepID=UPI0025533500|nr:conjugal transfer protein TraW [Massilia varians]MDK6076245.1 conjugal transfer protein TraW [Massilia varians]
MRFKKTLLAAAVLAAVTATPSFAMGDAAVLAPLINATTAAVNATTAAVTSGFGTIMQSLMRIENLLSANSAKVANQVAESSQNMVERNIDIERSRQTVELERRTRMPLDPCANASRGMADPNFDQINPGFRGANGATFGPRGMGASFRPKTGSPTLDKAVDIARNDAPAPPPEVQAVMAQRGACEAYASGSVRAQACTWAGTSPKLSSGLPDADIRASTIFDGAQTAADQAKVSLTFNEKQLAAAAAYVRNLSVPVQLRDLTKIEAQTDEGRRYLALRDSFQARVDLAMRPTEEWTSNRTPYAATIPILKAMKEGSGAASRYLAKHLPKAAPEWESKGVSLHHLQYIDAARRYENPEWLKEIGAADEVTLQREQLLISAQMASLLSKNLLATEKTNALLGAVYQASLNKDFMPELAAQHKRATSTR